jgi:hypothetical protein
MIVPFSTKPIPARTNLDWAKLVEKRDKREGIAFTESSKLSTRKGE